MGLVLHVSTTEMTFWQIEISSDIIDSNHLDQRIEKLFFDLILSKMFPCEPPKVLCKTKFCHPTIADGRDLLEEIIEWNA